MKCGDCRYWTPLGQHVTAVGRCDIAFPPGLEPRPLDRTTDAGQGCDLGRPYAGEGDADADS